MGDFSCGSMGTMDDYADGPVYGEKSKAGQYVVWGALAGITGWVLYCVIISIVYGLYHWEHFGFALLIVCTYVHMLFAFGLWKKSDQEEGRFMINFVEAPITECPTCPPPPINITRDTDSGAILTGTTCACNGTNTNGTNTQFLYRKLNLMSNSKLVRSN